MVKIKVKAFKHGESVGVVIPKEVREPLGVGVGDELLVDIDTIDGEKVIIYKKKERKGKGGKADE